MRRQFLHSLLLSAALLLAVVAAGVTVGPAAAGSSAPPKGCSATDVRGCTSDPASLAIRKAVPKPGYYVGSNTHNFGAFAVSFYVTPDGKSIVKFSGQPKGTPAVSGVFSWGTMFYVTPGGTATTTPQMDPYAKRCTIKGTTRQTLLAPITVSRESGAKGFQSSKQALDLGGMFLSSTTVDGGVQTLNVESPCGMADSGLLGFTAHWKNASQPK